MRTGCPFECNSLTVRAIALNLPISVWERGIEDPISRLQVETLIGFHRGRQIFLGPSIGKSRPRSGQRRYRKKGGRERQNYALSDMFFAPAALVSRLSFDMTLEPGDVILCGTSLGVLPMKPGSVVEVQIDGIGTLRNTYAPQAAA